MMSSCYELSIVSFSHLAPLHFFLLSTFYKAEAILHHHAINSFLETSLPFHDLQINVFFSSKALLHPFPFLYEHLKTLDFNNPNYMHLALCVWLNNANLKFVLPQGYNAARQSQNRVMDNFPVIYSS